MIVKRYMKLLGTIFVPKIEPKNKTMEETIKNVINWAPKAPTVNNKKLFGVKILVIKNEPILIKNVLINEIANPNINRNVLLAAQISNRLIGFVIIIISSPSFRESKKIWADFTIVCTPIAIQDKEISI